MQDHKWKRCWCTFSKPKQRSRKANWPIVLNASFARTRGRRFDRLRGGSDTMNHQKWRATHVGPEVLAQF